MTENAGRAGTTHPFLRRLTRKNVLAGLMFIGIAALGLWLSRDYPVGTLRRMSTGFMPQLLCWLLMGLGAVVLLQGLLGRDTDTGATLSETSTRESWGAIFFVAASLVAFGLSIERLGLIAAIVILVLIASFAYRGLKWWETLITAVVLVGLSWAVFVAGLGMTVKVLPELSFVIPDQRAPDLIRGERRSGTQRKECAKRAILSASHAPCAGSRVSLAMLALHGMTSWSAG